MMTKIASALLLSSALLAPGIASAQTTPSLDQTTPSMEQTFVSRGLCESTLKQLRNTARQTVKATPAGSGQTNAAVNRFANPLIKFACTAVSGKDGKTVFKIVEQA